MKTTDEDSRQCLQRDSIPMLAIIRKMLKLIKEDHRLLVNYERSHPHFLWYLGLDALLSVAIILGGYHFVASNSSTAQNLVHAGGVSLSSGEFINHVKRNDLETYWLGPISSYKYTINHETPGIVDVFYLPKSSDPSTKNLFKYEVKTYENQKTWDAHGHTLLATSNTTTIPITNKIFVKINKGSMKGEIVTFSDKPVIVAMAYPTRQSLQTMIKNAEKLKLVR